MKTFIIALLSLQFTESAFKCGDSIRRSIAGPDDWTKIIGTGKKYTDSSMPADNSMVVWPGFARKDSAQLTSYLSYIKSFKRPTSAESSPSLWGSRINPHDIFQGSVGDCYMVSVAAALAEWPHRI